MLILAVFWLMPLMVTSPSLEAIVLRELEASQRRFCHTPLRSLTAPSRAVAVSSLSFTADSPTYPVQLHLSRVTLPNSPGRFASCGLLTSGPSTVLPSLRLRHATSSARSVVSPSFLKGSKRETAEPHFRPSRLTHWAGLFHGKRRASMPRASLCLRSFPKRFLLCSRHCHSLCVTVNCTP